MMSTLTAEDYIRYGINPEIFKTKKTESREISTESPPATTEWSLTPTESPPATAECSAIISGGWPSAKTVWPSEATEWPTSTTDWPSAVTTTTTTIPEETTIATPTPESPAKPPPSPKPKSLDPSPLKRTRSTSTSTSTTPVREDLKPIIARKKKEHSYNLRETRSQKRFRFSSRGDRLSDGPKHRLMPVNPDDYHQVKSFHEEALIDATRIIRPAQVVSFEDRTGEYVIFSWLASARIYRYTRGSTYEEIRRIPKRYIDITANIITCLHYCDGKIYIAYMRGQHDGRPYLEVRNLEGNLVRDIMHFNEGEVIDYIQSDQDFIYMKWRNSGLLDIHRKAFFGTMVGHYCIDFKYEFGRSVGSTWVDQATFNSYSKLPLVSATGSTIMVTQYDAFKHRLVHYYDFKDNYSIVSMIKVDKLYIIHRKQGQRCMIDFGFLGKSRKNSKEFLHEASITFKDESDIIQVKFAKSYLYIYGSTKLLSGSKIYQLGCFYLPSLRPLWVRKLTDADDRSHITPHSSGIGFINGCQKITSIPKPKDIYHCDECGFGMPSKDEFNDHQKNLQHASIMTGMIIKTNEFMQKHSVSIFKRLYAA